MGTQDDAKFHPEYDELVSKLLVNVRGTWFNNGGNIYNFFCFIRWIAMAAVGGGWMSDIDTFPLFSNPSFTLPNNGTFTSYGMHVPTHVAGSAAEWNRITKLMMENYDKNSNHGHKFWSDMLELENLLKKKLLVGENDIIVVDKVYTEITKRFLHDRRISY